MTRHIGKQLVVFFCVGRICYKAGLATSVYVWHCWLLPTVVVDVELGPEFLHEVRLLAKICLETSKRQAVSQSSLSVKEFPSIASRWIVPYPLGRKKIQHMRGNPSLVPVVQLFSIYSGRWFFFVSPGFVCQGCQGCLSRRFSLQRLSRGQSA